MPEEDGLGCKDQSGGLPHGGAGDVPGYWVQQWNGETACQPAGYQTAYDIHARDDYKRCVCDFYGSGAADCPQAEGSPEPPTPPTPPTPPSPDDSDDEEDSGDDEPPTPPPNPWETWQTLEEIRKEPHYNKENSHSRTMYMIDRELEFLE